MCTSTSGRGVPISTKLLTNEATREFCEQERCEEDCLTVVEVIGIHLCVVLAHAKQNVGSDILSSLSILSEIARLMFFRFRSREMNMSHAHNVILQSSYKVIKIDFPLLSLLVLTFRTSLFSSSAVQVNSGSKRWRPSNCA